MTTALAAAAVLAGLVYLVLQVLLHRAPTGYSPVRNALSDYGVGSTARWFRLAGLANTLVLLLLAAAMLVDGASWRSRGVLLLGLAAAARVVVAFVPTDAPGRGTTSAGRVHLLAAVVQFAAIYSFLAGPGEALVRGTAWQTPVHLLTLLALVGLVGVCLGVVPAVRRWFGLVERVFLWSSTAALLGCALALAT